MHNVRPVSRLSAQGNPHSNRVVKAMGKDGVSMADAAKRVGYSPNHLIRLLDEERPSVLET